MALSRRIVITCSSLCRSARSGGTVPWKLQYEVYIFSPAKREESFIGFNQKRIRFSLCVVKFPVSGVGGRQKQHIPH